MTSTSRSAGTGGTPVPPRNGRSRPGRPGSRPVPRSGSARQARQSRRNRNRLLAWGAVAVVVAVVGVLIGVKATSSSPGGPLREPAPAAAVSHITSIPPQVLAAGASRVGQLYGTQPAKGGPISSGGKPQILYIGAEFCPICATERWPLTVALSQFGKFTNLQETHSAVTDGNIQTLSYYGSTYSSPYLTFTPVEVNTNKVVGDHYGALETPTPAEQALWTTNQPNGGVPFIDFAGKFVLLSSQFPDNALSGMSFNDIVNSVGTNDNTVGAAIDGSAAVLTKQICSLTGQQPSSVCSTVSNVTVPSESSNGSSSAG